MTPTQGVISSAILLVLGVGTLVWARHASGLGKGLALLFGALLSAGGVVWLLLSVAAERGQS
jgi:hypothetical protein